MALDFSAYANVSRPITLKLGSGQELEAKFYPNYQTQENLDKIDSYIDTLDKAEDGTPAAGFSLAKVSEALRYHLSLSLSWFDIVVDGVTLPTKTQEDRQAALARIGYHDLNAFLEQISKEIQKPFLSEETTSLGG